MKRRLDTPEADPLEPAANEAPFTQAEGASDSTLLVLLGSVIALLLLCIAFVLIAA
jgi:hypothetical protein